MLGKDKGGRPKAVISSQNDRILALGVWRTSMVMDQGWTKFSKKYLMAPKRWQLKVSPARARVSGDLQSTLTIRHEAYLEVVNQADTPTLARGRGRYFRDFENPGTGVLGGSSVYGFVYANVVDSNAGRGSPIVGRAFDFGCGCITT